MGFIKSLKNAFFGNEMTNEPEMDNESSEVHSKEPFNIEDVEISPELAKELFKLIKSGKKVEAIKVLKDSSNGAYSLEFAKSVIEKLERGINGEMDITVREVEVKAPPAISRAVVDLVLSDEMVKAIKQLRDESNGYYGLKEAKEIIDKLKYEAEHELLNPEFYGSAKIVEKSEEIKVSQAVIELIVDGKKVPAIKLLIDESGNTLTLKDAKTKVEEMEAYLKENYK